MFNFLKNTFKRRSLTDKEFVQVLLKELVERTLPKNRVHNQVNKALFKLDKLSENTWDKNLLNEIKEDLELILDEKELLK